MTLAFATTNARAHSLSRGGDALPRAIAAGSAAVVEQQSESPTAIIRDRVVGVYVDVAPHTITWA